MDRASQSRAPRMLGRYALYEKIASGGMASVHIGRLLGPVGFARTVAIKRMHPQLAEDPEFVSMFLDEARLAARIRHPHVVPTLDVVALDGELFLVMEYVEGESLARLIRCAGARGERIPPAMVATLMVGVLHGLHAAHEARNDRGEPLGLVHRDVSPHNVLVGTDGVARVLDFGVAKAVGRIQTTREGQLKGKLPYMAPEQVRGVVTRASDVYSASVVLWEALTGRRLFGGDNEAEVLAKVVAGCQASPSHHVSDLPPALDAVTMRGLSPDMGQRFATAREMARALENAMPLVAASVIGEWVEEAAKETLDERSARIAAIETDSSAHSPVVELAPGQSGADPLTTVGAPAAPTDGTGLTQLSSGSISAPGGAPAAAPTGSRALVAAMALAGGAVLLVAGALVTGSMRRAAPPAESAADPAASPPTATTPDVPAAASVAPPSAPADASSAVAAGSPSQASSVAGPATTQRPPAPARPPAAPASRCNPPFYFDSRGVRVFKPECL